jgi:hypothetical protein
LTTSTDHQLPREPAFLADPGSKLPDRLDKHLFIKFFGTVELLTHSMSALTQMKEEDYA